MSVTWLAGYSENCQFCTDRAGKREFRSGNRVSTSPGRTKSWPVWCRTSVVVWQVCLCVHGGINYRTAGGWESVGDGSARVKCGTEGRRKRNYEERNAVTNAVNVRGGGDTSQWQVSEEPRESGNFVFVGRDTQIPRFSRKSGRIAKMSKKKKTRAERNENRMYALNMAKKGRPTPTYLYDSYSKKKKKKNSGIYFNGRLPCDVDKTNGRCPRVQSPTHGITIK